MLRRQTKSLRFKKSWRFTQVAVTLVLTLSFLMVLPRGASLAGVSPATPTDSASESLKGGDKKVKKFRGDTVRHYIEKARLKNKGLARAMRDYAKKGLTPKWEESVTAQQVSETSAVAKPKGLFQRASFAPQQESVAEGGNTITFVTYSGDFNTWDGIVYVSTPYSDDTYTGDFQTPTDDGSYWDVVNEVYYPPDGGTPCDGSRVCMQMEQQASKAAPANKQKAGKEMASLAHGSSTKTLKPGLWGWLKRWWGCVGNVCGWSDWTCTGWSRFFCRVYYCVGGLFWCL